MIIPSCLRDQVTRRANTSAGFLSLCLYHNHLVYFMFMLYAPPLCHVEFNNLSVGQHPLLHMYRKTSHIKMSLDFRRTRKCVMGRDLSWCKQPIFSTLCYNKTALHRTLASAKPVSKLQPVSVHPLCARLSSNRDRVCLRPKPAFMPKSFLYSHCQWLTGGCSHYWLPVYELHSRMLFHVVENEAQTVLQQCKRSRTSRVWESLTVLQKIK